MTASTIILRAFPHRITAVLANYHAIGGEQLPLTESLDTSTASGRFLFNVLQRVQGGKGRATTSR